MAVETNFLSETFESNSKSKIKESISRLASLGQLTGSIMAIIIHNLASSYSWKEEPLDLGVFNGEALVTIACIYSSLVSILLFVAVVVLFKPLLRSSSDGNSLNLLFFSYFP